MSVTQFRHRCIALTQIPECLRKSVVWAAGALFLASVSGHTFAADKPLTSVADLRYGVALYHYYQNQNLQALSELLVAQKKGGIQGHGDNPEIMEGGFSMAYGMERKASEIFERLLDNNRPQKTRDAAWYYLAKMRYLRGDWTAAKIALDKISKDPGPSLAGESSILRFNVALRENELDSAEQILRKSRPAADALPYLHYNLGAAYSRSGRYELGVDYFSRLLDMKERSPEYLGLYDKSMTAAGYAYLLQKNYTAAIDHFTQVRLDSPLSNRALLGYGWAAVEMENYALALKPWQVLAKRPLIDENTQEALVAIPYAYEKMGYRSLALDEFRHAESNYLGEITKLDQVIDNVQGYAIQAALNIDRSADIDWLNYAAENQLAPQLSYLVPLFSQETFLGLVQELRDLLAIQVQFAEWQQKLAFYSEMLNEREANRVLELDFLEQQQLAEKIQAMTLQRDKFAAELARMQREQDILGLVSEEDAPKLERILRAEKNAKLLQQAVTKMGVEVMPADELSQLSETLRKQKGFMVWHTAELFDERFWRARAELAQVNAQLQKINTTQNNVQNIIDQGFDLAPYRQRIAAASEQLTMQSIDIDHAIELSQDALRNKVLLVLEQQRERLYHYLAQSRLAIARLLDQASMDAEKATSPEPEATNDTPAADEAAL